MYHNIKTLMNITFLCEMNIKTVKLKRILDPYPHHHHHHLKSIENKHARVTYEFIYSSDYW